MQSDHWDGLAFTIGALAFTCACGFRVVQDNGDRSGARRRFSRGIGIEGGPNSSGEPVWPRLSH